MKTIFRILFSMLTVVLPARACLNGYDLPEPPPKVPFKMGKMDVKFDVQPVLVDKVQSPNTSQFPAGLELMYHNVIAAYENDPAKHSTLEERTNYAVALAYLGHYKEAIPVLQAIEKDFPGAYSTATNMGTVYELLDNLKEAEFWIQKGLERNPRSHEGTEWLHLAIIRTKLSLVSDPSWLNSHSVIGDQEKRDEASVLHAIEYQLNERLNFVKAPDGIVSDLFFQAAKRTEDPVKRAYYLQQSLRFGDIRKNEVEGMQKG